ncbi:MAG TPA: pyruvate kinase alpha/beta domain-containing protein, partial [Bacteroidales bacterium]|nr:pyruvate kinase alpha/beta domain-containing protein [Bacteroidales bacterium]
SYRGINLIMAQCYSERTMREMALSYGVYASLQERRNTVDEFIHIALDNLVNTHKMNNDDLIVVLAGNFSGGAGFSFIEVGTVRYLKDRAGTED